MSTSADFPSFQYSATNYNKFSTQEGHDDPFFDKENCNVYQPRTSQRLPFQPKNMNTNTLSERMEELSYQSTIDSSVDFDQISRFSEDFALPTNFLEPTGPKECLHTTTTTRRCTYCKECGIFLPRVIFCLVLNVLTIFIEWFSRLQRKYVCWKAHNMSG